MLRVVNHGAACAVIEARGFRILMDPWIVGTAYLGAWDREHYLPDPVAAIGNVDVIWISHLHQDHLSIESLRLLRKAWPDVPIWCGTHCPHLRRMLAEFSPVVQDLWVAGSVRAYSFPSPHEHSEGIDSYLLVMDDDSAVVNFNDLPFHEEAVENVRQSVYGLHLTALLPYAGAGPHPQAYRMSHMERWTAAKEKERRFIAQFQQYREVLKPDVAVAFSAGYVLRGPLAALNHERGIPDPTTIPGATVLPVIGVGERPATVFDGYDWENDPVPLDETLHRLITAAEARSIKLDGPALSVCLDWGTGSRVVSITPTCTDGPHETITFDACLLAGMLEGRYHANSIEVGSCVKITRHGNGYDSRVWSYLYRFHA
jgi:hypothetical protein